MSKGTDGMSALELALLTPDERAALDEETSPEEAAAQTDVATNGEPADTDDVDTAATAIAPAAAGTVDVIEPDGDDVPPAAAPAAAAPAADKPAATDAVATPAADAPAPEPFAVRLPVAAAEDFDKQISELQTRYDEGEISSGEYTKELMSIQDRRTRAALAEELNTQVEQQLWQRAITDFMVENPQYKQSTVLYGALNAVITELESAEGKDRLTGPALLREAHKQVMKEFGLRVPAETAAAPAKPASRAGKPPDLSKVPTTLANVPVAEAADTGKDKFAELDRLADTDWQAYEAALARMSPAEQRAYAEAGVQG